MKNYKRFIVPVLLCAVIFGATIFFFSLREKAQGNSDHFIQEKKALLRLVQNSSEIHRLWEEGEDSREWGEVREACLKKWGVTAPFDESLLRCNPLLLQCYGLFKKHLNYTMVPQEEFDNTFYRYVNRANSSVPNLKEEGIALTIEDNETKKRLDIFLADQCQEVYLEQRAYAYGEQVLSKDGVDYRFDNFNRHIYLDTHLVTNAEVNDWIKFGDQSLSRGLQERAKDKLFLPATGLTYAQMENFCSFKGKQLMLAHFFDAATFFPMDLKELIPRRNLRSPYYWTKKSSEFRPDCSLFYYKECLQKKPYQLNASGPSWAGLKDPMGGVLEAFRNPIDPESNLKASSFYFEGRSSWHKLGFRAGWDGEGFDLRHFDFRGLNPFVATDLFQVGFRCMREVGP